MLSARASARVHLDVLKLAVCAPLARFGVFDASYLLVMFAPSLDTLSARCSQFVALKFISKSVFGAELPYGVSAAPGSMPLVPSRRFSKIIQLVRIAAVLCCVALGGLLIFIFQFAAQGSGRFAKGALLSYGESYCSCERSWRLERMTWKHN